MLKSLFAAIAILGFAAPALAGSGCGSSHTAQSGNLEVAQTDQATKPLPQTPQPQTTTQ